MREAHVVDAIEDARVRPVERVFARGYWRGGRSRHVVLVGGADIEGNQAGRKQKCFKRFHFDSPGLSVRFGNCSRVRHCSQVVELRTSGAVGPRTWPVVRFRQTREKNSTGSTGSRRSENSKGFTRRTLRARRQRTRTEFTRRSRG